MDGWQELISNIVTSAMWPAVVLTLGIVFRGTLRSVVARITKLEAFGANIEIGENLKKVEDAADQVQIEAVNKGTTRDDQEEPNPPSSQMASRHLVEVARISPPAAIVDAWREVETALLDYWEVVRVALGGPVDNYPNITRVIDRLKSAQMLSPKQANLLLSLRRTRNSVAHTRTQPSEGQALSFVESAAIARRSLISDTWAVKRREHGVPPL